MPKKPPKPARRVNKNSRPASFSPTKAGKIVPTSPEASPADGKSGFSPQATSGSSSFVPNADQHRSPRAADVKQFSEGMTKQQLGERLFPLVRDIDAQRAEIVTGMLLELSIPQIECLLLNPACIGAHVEDCVRALSAFEEQQMQAQQMQVHQAQAQQARHSLHLDNNIQT